MRSLVKESTWPQGQLGCGIARVELHPCNIPALIELLLDWSVMNWRWVLCAIGTVVGSTVPSMLYADQQACETLVAVSYLTAEKPRNASLDVVHALAEKTQLRIKVEAAQRRKALAEVRSGRVDLIIGVSLETEKDAPLDYLTPAYTEKTYRLWLRTGEQVSLTQWPELSGLRGVQVITAKPLMVFDRQAEQLNWPIRAVDSLAVAIDKVLQGRADYVLAEQQAMQQYIVQHDLGRRFEAIDPPVETQGFFVAMAKDSACHTPALRSRLNKALLALSQPQ